VAKAPALVWEIKHSNNGVPHIQRKTPWLCLLWGDSGPLVFHRAAQAQR